MLEENGVELIQCLDARALHLRVKETQPDIVLINEAQYLNTEAREVVAHKLWSESPAVALPVDHALAALPAITADDLNDSLPIYAAAPHAAMAALVTQSIQTRAQRRSACVEAVLHTEQMLTLVGSGLGIGLTNESAAALHSAPRVVFRKFLGEDISATTWLLRKRGVASSSICKIIRIARDLA